MAFFKFEINSVEEAKIAKAMLDTYIKLSEGSNDKVVNKPKVDNADTKPTVKEKVNNKPKKEVKKVETTEEKKDVKSTKKVSKQDDNTKTTVSKKKKDTKFIPKNDKDDINFVDIQNLCRHIVSLCDNEEIEQQYRIDIANISLKYGKSKAIRDIKKSNYPKAYSEIKELLEELEEIPY